MHQIVRSGMRRIMLRQVPRVGLSLFAAIWLCGCSRAPTIDVDGSFLPAWMLCLITGLVITFLIHWQVTQRRMQERIRPAVVFYPSMVVGIACLIWLLLFR